MRQALTGSRQGDHRAVQISALGEIYRGAAEDPDRQNPALSAAAKPRCFVRRELCRATSRSRVNTIAHTVGLSHTKMWHRSMTRSRRMSVSRVMLRRRKNGDLPVRL